MGSEICQGFSIYILPNSLYNIVGGCVTMRQTHFIDNTDETQRHVSRVTEQESRQTQTRQIDCT